MTTRKPATPTKVDAAYPPTNVRTAIADTDRFRSQCS